jgi:hypothetical protein
MTVSSPVVTYGGQHIDAASLPAKYRGPQFAVQRGDAVEAAYRADDRYLGAIEGQAAQFGDSLRQIPAFWESAAPVSVSVEGATVNGWYLTGAPVQTTKDPASGTFTRVAGPAWVFLPDVRGTAILLTGQGYGQTELLALASSLKRAS